MGTLAKIFLPSLDWRTKALNFGKDFPAILGLTNKSSTWELWQRFSCHPWTDEQKLYVGTLAKIFLPSLDWRTKALRGNFGKDFPAILGLNKSSMWNIGKDFPGKDFPAILGLSNKSSMWELWQRFSCHPWTDEQKLYVGTLAKIFLPSLDWRTKALRGNFGKDFPAILGLTNKSSTWELWQRFSCHPWTDEQKLYVGTLAKIFLPSLDWRTKALRGNFGKDFPAILGLTNKSSTWELWQRFSCHPWTDEQKLYVGTLAKIFLPSLDWRTKALRGNFGKDFPAILGLTNKSSTWELWQRFSCHPWTDEQKLYVGTLAKIFLPSLDWRTKALRGNFGKDFPAILGLTNKSSTWELWQRFSCHPWTDEQKLYVGTLAKIFLPSLDWRTKALRGNFGKDFPAILGLTNKSSKRFSLAKIFLPSLDWRTKALCGNFGKDFPAILGLTNKSSTWELWQRFSCHPWTDEQKLYVGTLAKIFLPSLDWRTKALRGNFGKDFPAILGLTNKSSTWELWQRFSCHPWTDEQKLYVGTLAKIFLPSLDWRTPWKSSTWELWQRFSCHPWTDEQKLYVGTLKRFSNWRTKALRGNFGKDFPAILGLTNKSSTWELWQRFSCHPWTDEQKLYVGTLAKIFLPSLDWRTKALHVELWQRFSCHPWTDEQKLYVETLAKIFLPSLDCRMAKIFLPSLDCRTKALKIFLGRTLAKIFLPSLDWRTKALRGNFGKDFPAILGLTNKSSTWELWQRFSCHPWTDEQKLYVGTLAKIFLPSLDWRTKALCGNFGKDFPAILGLTNKSSTWELWQRFSCHPWTDEQKLYVGTLAKIFLPSLDWRTKALRGNFGKDFPAILGLTNKSSMWELWQRFSCHPWTDEQKLYVGTKIFLPSLDCGNSWQRFSCHPWTDEQKLYVGTLAKIFLPSLDWRTKALRGNFGKDFPAILGLNKSSMWELWQRFSCHPWTVEQKLYVETLAKNLPLAKIFLPSLDWRTKALCGNFGKDFPAILGLTNKSSTWELWQRFSCHPWTDEQKLYVGTLAKIFLPSLDWRTKALRGNFGKDFPAILGLTNKSSTWELWQRFSCHPWTDEQKLYVGNFGKDFPAILGLTNKSSTWELWQRFSCHPWTDEQKLYVGTLAKIFLPSLDCRTKALRGNIGKDFPAILRSNGRFSCHPWTVEQKLYVGTLAKIFLPSLDWRTKALRGNFGKDFPAILGLTNKSSMWELWQRFSCHPWTDEQKLYVGTLAKIFLPSLDWRTKALRGNFGKDFPAILGLTNKSSTWELWQRFSCHPWTDEQKLYVGTLAKIFLPSLDWRTKALRGNFGKDFPAILGLTILGLTNKSSTWELWQRFSCHPWTDEQKALCGNIGKDFPAILRLSNGKDFPAILGLSNKSSMWEHWQRFSCHPWTDEQKLYVGTLAKIFLPSLDWRTKALRGNFGKDFPAILGLSNKSSTCGKDFPAILGLIEQKNMSWILRLSNGKDFPAILGLSNKSSMWELWQRFSCHPWTDEQKLYVGTLAKIFLPSLDWRTKALRGNFGKDFPAILGLTNKSSTWELWQRFSCHPWTDEQKLYVGTLAKIFLPSLDWRTKALLTNKSWELWQRFSCHPWTDEQKLYVGTLAKIFLPSLDWRTKALRGNFGKDFPAILGLTNKSSTWELWQRFSCHPWTDEQKLYVGTLAKIFLPSLDWRTKALRGNFGKDFPAILGLTNKSSTWELWQRFSCHPWTDKQKLYCWRKGNFGKDFPAILRLSTWKHWQRFSCHS